jgi:hypothetical protein
VSRFLLLGAELKAYPPEHVVTLLWTDGLPEYNTQAKSMAPKDLAQEYAASSVEIVGGAEPCSQLGVDVGGRRDLDAMCDAIFFGEAAGVKEALGKFAFVGGEAEPEIDAGVGGGLNLCEDMFAYKGTMVLQGQALTSGPSDLPSERSSA